MAARVRNKRVARDVTRLAGLRLALYCRASKDAKKREKSVSDQEAEGQRWGAEHGCVIVGSYVDNALSASRYATKERESFDRLVADLRAGKIDILWVWEVSRSQRELGVFVELRNLCRELGVLWVVGERVFDPSNYLDAQTLGTAAVNAETESEIISARVRRGKASSAVEGKPTGAAKYGYVREYDAATGEYIRQIPDSTRRECHREDGAVEWYTSAGIVAEIGRRIAAGESIRSVTESLNTRGVPAPRGGLWQHSVVRDMAVNPTYIGARVHQGEIVATGCWPALVDEETHWACVRMLTDRPVRAVPRPARAVHLLSYITACDSCGAPMQAQNPSRDNGHRIYRCKRKLCSSVRAAELDEFVERVMVAWLSREDVNERLRARGAAGDEKVAQAHAEAEAIRGELLDWQNQARNRQVSAASFAAVEPGLLQALADAEERERMAPIPPVLRELIGPDAEQKWYRATVEVKRKVIRLCADIRIVRVGWDDRRNIRMRINWTWLLGPNVPITDLDTGT